MMELECECCVLLGSIWWALICFEAFFEWMMNALQSPSKWRIDSVVLCVHNNFSIFGVMRARCKSMVSLFIIIISSIAHAGLMVDFVLGAWDACTLHKQCFPNTHIIRSYSCVLLLPVHKSYGHCMFTSLRSCRFVYYSHARLLEWRFFSFWTTNFSR